jgi:hypothetical protein
MGHLHHHDLAIGEVEEAGLSLSVAVEGESKLPDFLQKQANFKELFFHNLDFLNRHTVGKLDSKHYY